MVIQGKGGIKYTDTTYTAKGGGGGGQIVTLAEKKVEGGQKNGDIG